MSLETKFFDGFNRTLLLGRDAIDHFSSQIEKNTPLKNSILGALKIFKETRSTGGRVIFSGIGKSGKIAQKLSATFASTGTPSFYLHPSEAPHGDLGMVSSLDCVVALSQTGNTPEILDLIPMIQDRKIPIVAFTGNEKSQLSLKANITVLTEVSREACPHNLAPTTSTTLMLTLGDAFAVGLMEDDGFDKKSFQANHPGGALGKRLSLKVHQVYKPLDECALVHPDSSITDVFENSSKKGHGAALVLDSTQKKLLGIVTDGDIRRALHHKEKFFQLQAHDIMTKNPSTISAEALAFEALKQMEDRPSQISVLPVVDSNGDCIGLVRLHDLLQQL